MTAPCFSTITCQPPAKRVYEPGKVLIMTHYDILGINRTALDTEIKKAYHQMIIAFHPDTYQGDKQFAAKKTHEIIEAYKVLRNPASRRLYDDSLDSHGHNTSEKINKNTPVKPKGMHKYKVALSIIGILFVVFVVALFLMIILSM